MKSDDGLDGLLVQYSMTRLMFLCTCWASPVKDGLVRQRQTYNCIIIIQLVQANFASPANFAEPSRKINTTLLESNDLPTEPVSQARGKSRELNAVLISAWKEIVINEKK